MDPYVAVIVAVDVAAVTEVLARNVPLVLPTGTETVKGTVTDFELEDSFTRIAPLEVPGAAFSVTVPVDLLPGATDEGDIERL